jgi:hypothetical protein
MMEFRIVKQSLIDLFGEQAEGRFQVVGYQRQSKNASELTGDNKFVQVYYSEGEFPKSHGRQNGAKTHNITIDIDMSCAAYAEVDLSILDSDTATQQQKASALFALREAAEIADEEVDKLIEYVYQIIMDSRNFDIDLTRGTISDRWLDRITKDTTIERGDLVVKTANMKYSCRVQESVLGETGNSPDTVEINSSTPAGEEVAGVNVTNDN